MLKLRITKQYDCKGKWYIISLEDGDKIIHEHDINVQWTLRNGKKSVKDLIKMHIRKATERARGWIIIKDESRGEWKYIEHLVPAYHDNEGVYVSPRKNSSRVKGELC